MTDKKPLCYAPFIHMHASKYGYAPCCVYLDKQQFNSPEEYWSSDYLKSLRAQMLEGNTLPSSCSVCVDKINSGILSDLQHWSMKRLDMPITPSIELGNQTKNPIFIEYKPSNKCNLMCRMCKPDDSNLIYNEAVNNEGLAKFYHNTRPLTNSIEDVESFVSLAQELHVLGGEPALEPKTLSFLDKVYHLNPSIKLKVTTNATAYNKKFIDSISRFKNLKVVISIDAVGKTYEYIRTYAKWKNTNANIHKMLRDNFAKQYSYTAVVTPYNIFNIVELLEWYIQLPNHKKIFFYFCNSDDLKTSISCIMDEHKEHTIDLLYANRDRLKEAPVFDVIDLLTKVQFNQVHYNMFVDYNRIIDNLRKTKLSDIDVRFKKYI